MDYTAVNVGKHDLSAGYQFAKSLELMPWVSSSFSTSTGSSLFPQFIINEKAGYRIGITGITSKPKNLDQSIIFSDWKTSLAQIVDELQNKSDFIILLSTLPFSENRIIAQKFPEIRLFISSSSTSSNIVPKQIGNALLTQTGNRGKYLGYLTLSDIHHPFANESLKNELTSKQQTLHSLSSRIHQLKSSTAQIDSNVLENLEQNRKKTIKRIYALEGELKEMQSSQYARYSSRFIPLSERMPEDLEISEIVQKLKK